MSLVFTYIVDGLNPVVLISGHVELFEDVGRFPNCKDFDIGCIIDINLKICQCALLSTAMGIHLFNKIDDSYSYQQPIVDFTDDLFLFLGSKGVQESHAFIIDCICVRSNWQGLGVWFSRLRENWWDCLNIMFGVDIGAFRGLLPTIPMIEDAHCDRLAEGKSGVCVAVLKSTWYSHMSSIYIPMLSKPTCRHPDFNLRLRGRQQLVPERLLKKKGT